MLRIGCPLTFSDWLPARIETVSSRTPAEQKFHGAGTTMSSEPPAGFDGAAGKAREGECEGEVLNKAATAAVRKLVQARKLDDAMAVVDVLVTQHKFTWRPVGDRENNYGSINIGSDPGHAFVERVTNAIDAVIEREAIRRLRKSKGRSVPATPRGVSQQRKTSSGCSMLAIVTCGIS